MKDKTRMRIYKDALVAVAAYIPILVRSPMVLRMWLIPMERRRRL